MQWTVQIIVSLLNVVWIVFFLQPDPFLVFVERRSTDGSAEFCVQPPSDMNWTSAVQSVTITANKPNNTNTTPEESEPRNPHEDINLPNMNQCPQHSQCNKTNIQPEDPHTTPAPEPKPEVKSDTNPTRSSSASDHPSSSGGTGPDDCCFSFYPRRVKKDLVKGYYMSDHRCPRTGVVLMTQKGRNICVDPNLSWVQNIMKYVDEKTS
ncbi:uncharacterized protein LOC108882053 [Lates calcarifer]|uniref:Uncharacterized protein LOC108882053 n=1 Tax=Lates calcarifer TaxID=8187 RepID=A0AAJ8BFN7_LATCA|nr:uncharacterized protein LOC108882053 [Lates calcarifer]